VAGTGAGVEAAGAAGALAAGAGLAGGLGMYSGPGWPQPASMAAAAMSAKVGFTIRITD
jgi:hypothetical protein